MNPDNLNDIVTPEAISWMPQTVGWWVVSIIAALIVVRWGWLRYRTWLAAGYRRDALDELHELKARLGDPLSRGDALVAIPPLVKRVVSSSAARSDVASLSGTAWLHFLNQTARRSTFTEGPGPLLPTLAYASSDRLAAISDSEVHALVARVEEWIRTHEIPAASPAAAQ